MTGWERTIVVLLCIVGITILIANISEAIFKLIRERREHIHDERRHAEEHELALADREVEMWKATLEAGAVPIFSKRGIAPKLVGNSQVLDRDAPAVVPASKGWATPTEAPPMVEPAGAHWDGPPAPVAEEPTHTCVRCGQTIAYGEHAHGCVPPRELEIQRCGRIHQHPGHVWMEKGVGPGEWWCEGLNADGTAPFDPARPGYVEGGNGDG